MKVFVEEEITDQVLHDCPPQSALIYNDEDDRRAVAYKAHPNDTLDWYGIWPSLDGVNTYQSTIGRDITVEAPKGRRFVLIYGEEK